MSPDRETIDLTARAVAIARYDRLFWRASKAGDLAECRRIEDSLVALLGLAAPDHRDLNMADVDAELARLDARSRAGEKS